MSLPILDDIDFENEDEFSEKEIILEKFIQRRSEIYISHLRNRKSITFDYLKMLIGIPWLFYRKMYWVALLLMFIGFENKSSWMPIFSILDIIASTIKKPDFSLSFFFNSAPTAFTMIICGFFNKEIYLRHSEESIQKIKNRSPNIVHFNHELKNKGGIEGIIPCMLIFILTGLFLIRIQSGSFNPGLLF